MMGLWLKRSPAAARVLPFAVFVALTFGQGQFGEASRYWFYLAKTLVGVWMLWVVRPLIPEMRWRMSWEGVAVGVIVFAIWVGLDPWYPGSTELWERVGCPLLGMVGLEWGCGEVSEAVAAPQWNPFEQFGAGSWLALLFVGTRILGSTLVVPVIEEVFYRSFLYRYVEKPDFLAVPLKYFGWTPFLLTAGIFGFAHKEWLAGILCGFAYQGLVIWKGRLGDAMTAHAVTNCLLGIWVVWKGAWHFW